MAAAIDIGCATLASPEYTRVGKSQCRHPLLLAPLACSSAQSDPLVDSTMSKLATSSRSPSQNRQVVASAGDQSSSQITKRKRSTDDNSECPPLRPAKRKKVKKAKRVEDENLDLEHGLNLAIGKLDSRLQADYVAQRTKHFSSELSLVELEDRHIPGIDGIDASGRIISGLLRVLILE